MKKFLLGLFILSPILLFISCTDDDNATAPAPEKIARFLTGETEIIVSEASTDIIEIPFFINYRSEGGPVTINLEFEGDPANFQLLSGNSVTIPTGQRQGLLLIQPIDNMDFNDPDNSVIVRIVSVDSGFELPDGTSIGYEEKKIVFQDNDCPPHSRDLWVGALDVTDVGFSTYAGAGELSDAGCNVIAVQGNLPGSGWYEDRFINIVLDEANGTAEAARQLFCDDCAGNVGTSRYYEASGTFDATTKEITLSYVYSDGSGGTVWSGGNVINPQ